VHPTSSDSELFLGLACYASSGPIGLYSLGFSTWTTVLAVPANWTGDLEYPCGHLPFVNGGYLRLEFAKCPASRIHSLPPNAERLLAKKFAIVADKAKLGQLPAVIRGRTNEE